MKEYPERIVLPIEAIYKLSLREAVNRYEMFLNHNQVIQMNNEISMYTNYLLSDECLTEEKKDIIKNALAKIQTLVFEMIDLKVEQIKSYTEYQYSSVCEIKQNKYLISEYEKEKAISGDNYRLQEWIDSSRTEITQLEIKRNNSKENYDRLKNEIIDKQDEIVRLKHVIGDELYTNSEIECESDNLIEQASMNEDMDNKHTSTNQEQKIYKRIRI